MLSNLSLRNMAHLLFRRRKTFVISLLVPPALCAVLVLPQASQYESTASVVVKVAEEEFVSPDQLAEQNGRNASSSAQLSRQIVSGAQLIMSSADVMRTALTRVGVSRVYPDAERNAAKGKVPPLEYATERLEKDLAVKISGETNVITLSLYNKDAGVAQQLLKEVLKASIQKQASVSRDPRTEFLDRKLEALRIDNASARKALLEFKQRTKITAFDEERTLLLRQRDETQVALSRTRAELVSAQGRGSVLQTNLAATPESIALSDENDRGQRIVEAAQQRVSTARARYEAASRKYTSNNLELSDIKADLDAANRELAQAQQLSQARIRKGINPLNTTLNTNLSTARSDATAYRGAVAERERQLVDINNRLAFLDANELELRDLEQRVTLTDNTYRSYQRRAESASILQDMNEAGISSLGVLQSPNRPYRPGKPNKPLLLSLSILAGVLAAFGICVLRETMDDTVSFPEQLQDVLGLPVLASVQLKKAHVLGRAS